MAGWSKRSWIIVTRSASPAWSCTTDAWAMPADASLWSGFTIRGNRTLSGTASASPGRQVTNPGTRMPWYARTFLLIALLRETSSASGGEPV